MKSTLSSTAFCKDTVTLPPPTTDPRQERLPGDLLEKKVERKKEEEEKSFLCSFFSFSQIVTAHARADKEYLRSQFFSYTLFIC